MSIDKDAHARETHTAPMQGVELRPLSLDDAQRYFDLIQYDTDHLRQFGDVTADKYPDVSSVEHSIVNQPPSVHRFGIWTDEESSKMVGLMKLTETRDTCFEVGYWVGKEYIGNGYARKALAEVDGYAFDSLNATQLEAHVVVGNEASAKTLLAAGYELFDNRDGTLIYMKGRW